MGDGAVNTVNNTGGDDGVKIFPSPILSLRPLSRGCRRPGRLVASDLAASLDQASRPRLEMRRPAARSTSSVSPAPHTPVRRILALSNIFLAMSSEAALST